MCHGYVEATCHLWITCGRLISYCWEFVILFCEVIFLVTCNGASVALPVAKSISYVTPSFCNLQCNKDAVLQVAREEIFLYFLLRRVTFKTQLVNFVKMR